ncbi:MAG: hypothetical protein M1820_004676 [Bogoriella megaspora]|nr:MAG: hypothetical protein M1820_004676 [Bogoriella megaspora]
MSEDTQALDNANSDAVPVLLLKTKSQPTDGYQEYFSSLDRGQYLPQFVPVLEHNLKDAALTDLSKLIEDGCFGINKPVCANEDPTTHYGGIIFTSQRAVEAFITVIEQLRKLQLPLDILLPPSMPLYVVGPATARGLKALGLNCRIVGEESGNGETLARFILHDYNSQEALCKNRGGENYPLLFLVGEQRRDIIPKTLDSNSLEPWERISVREIVVYETKELLSFQGNFVKIWAKCKRFRATWIVIFSPTGCKAMLEALDLNKAARKSREDDLGFKRPYIAAIGPTTRDYLVNELGFEPDITASKPSPDGLGVNITRYMQAKPAR